MEADRTVVIDFLPESARNYDEGWAVVAVDILRATTTAVTIVNTGRRCFPVRSVEAARHAAKQLPDALLVGEVGGDLPEGFDLQNSPSALQALGDLERPAILLSSSGTRIFAEARGTAAYAACLRNSRAQVAHLAANHPRVAVIGAGTKGEFRREDQYGCSRLAAGLLERSYRPGSDLTREVVERWKDAPVESCAGGRSVEYLRRTSQLEDLDFVLSHVDDLDSVVALGDGELREVAA